MSERDQNESLVTVVLSNVYGDDFLGTFGQLIKLIIIVIALRSLLYFLTSQISGYLIFNKLNKCIMHSKQEFFDKTPQGHIINTVGTDIQVVDYQLPFFFNQCLETSIMVIGNIIGVTYQYPFMLIIIIVLIYYIKNLYLLFSSANRELKRLSQDNQSQLLTILEETSKGKVIIRAYKRIEHAFQEYIKSATNHNNTYINCYYI